MHRPLGEQKRPLGLLGNAPAVLACLCYVVWMLTSVIFADRRVNVAHTARIPQLEVFGSAVGKRLVQGKINSCFLQVFVG